MKIFNIYILKNLTLATVFITLVLTFIIFLTQSLKFLEIVMNAGSSSSSFWILTGLALPRFFEVILPIAIMSGTLFLYNKMTTDSELIAMRATGHSSFSLAKPAMTLGLLATVILWATTLWISPISLSKMHEMRNALKTEFSSFLFKEGVFNQIGKGLTVYIREKQSDGSLTGLMIHDTRDTTKLPSTILAKQGVILVDDKQQKVVVYQGIRHEYNPDSKILQKLEFDRYTIDLPEDGIIKKRWAEPDERTIKELLNPDLSNKRDVESLREFSIEIHRRVSAPLLALAFPLIALTILLLGPVDRRGQTKRIIIAVITIMLVQSLYLVAYNIAKDKNTGLVLMYLLTIFPISFCLFWLSGLSEPMRRNILFGYKNMSLTT